MSCECACVFKFAAVQVTPIRRIRPHQSIDRMGARLAAQTSRNHATASWHRLRMGMGLMCAPNRTAESGIFQMVSARPDMRTQDTRRRAAAAGIFAPAGEPASCMKAACSVCHAHGMHVAAVAQVAAGLRLKRRLPGTCVRYHDNCCDLSEIAAPNGFRVQLEAMFPEYHVSLEPRARGHPWAIAVAPPHVARFFTFVPSVCSVHSRLGMGMPCDSGSSCSATDGRCAACARSLSIGSIMIAPSNASDHHRNRQSPEPMLRRASGRLCFCQMMAAATMDPRHVALVPMPALADSDPKARSALRN